MCASWWGAWACDAVEADLIFRRDVATTPSTPNQPVLSSASDAGLAAPGQREAGAGAIAGLDAAILTDGEVPTASLVELRRALGVDIEFEWQGVADTAPFDTLLLPRLTQLGVTRVRTRLDSAPTNPDEARFQRLRALQQAGIEVHLWLLPNVELSATDLQNLVSWSNAAVTHLEGPDDHDWQRTAGSEQDLLAFMTQLHEQRSSVPGLQLVEPTSRIEYSVDFSAITDVANIHAWLRGEPPLASIEQQIEAAQTQNRPLVITSANYSNAEASPVYVSEELAGVYLPRLWLGSAARGVQQVYIRRLFDSVDPAPDAAPERLKGLLRRDGTAKPAFDNLRWLMDSLDAANCGAAVGFQLYSTTSSIRQLRLTDAGQLCALVVWNEVPSGDESGERIPVDSVPASLVLDAARTLVLMRPGQMDERSGLEFDLQVSDEPLIVLFQ